MANTIKLNEAQLKELIGKAVNKIIKENNEAEEGSLKLDDSYEYALEELDEMAQRLKGFIKEYSILVETLIVNARKLGLQLSDYYSDDEFVLGTAMQGRSFDFQFEFKLPGVDTQNMSDEEYKVVEERLQEIYDKLHYEIGSPSYGTIKIYTTDDGIEVYYRFRLTDKDYTDL